jgi:protein phosphatase
MARMTVKVGGFGRSNEIRFKTPYGFRFHGIALNLTTQVTYTCAGRTDVGIIRSGNEDNYLMVPDRGVFIVADGMGGHAAGEVASEMAVRIIARELGANKGVSDAEAAERMRNAIIEANSAIFQRTLNEHDKRGMGTTATAMVIIGSHYLIGQVGDSRAYLLRDGDFVQLTKDHSYVQEQVDAGYLSPEEARTHPYSNVITRCVGANVDVSPDVYAGVLRPNDLYLLASDGLTGMIEDGDLHAILFTGKDPQDLVGELIDEANRRGGLDNITAILIRVDHVDGVPGSVADRAPEGG